MSNATNNKYTVEEYYGELVPVMLIKDNHKHKDDLTVTLNGTNYQIKRGGKVMVPRNVALVIERAHAQELAAEEYIENLSAGNIGVRE